LEALVLGVLRNGALHGYAISKAIKEQGAGALKLGENRLYPTLHNLESAGLVTAEWQPQENKPPRKVYQLTHAGHTELAKYRSQWEQYAAGVNSILGIHGALEGRNG
jgi:DNA-binding PadR family transcriptional regulator